MFNFKNKPLVVYLAYEPYKIEVLEKFLKSYEVFPSGYDHDLLICFKSFKDSQKVSDWSKKIPYQFIKFYDEEKINDFDIGSFFRVADKYKDRHILFLNSWARPNVKNWLKFFMDHYDEKKLIGAFGSYDSLPSNLFNFAFTHSKIKQIIWGIKHLRNVKLYPNPHIRTSAFFINAKDFLELKIDRAKLITKTKTFYFESGRKGMSNQLLEKGFELILVNSDNKSFEIKDWAYSETYCQKNQKKMIIADNRTDFYTYSDKNEQKISRKLNWNLD